jgi:RNA polymerase sigma-70 factor (ECF subfamily)
MHEDDRQLVQTLLVRDAAAFRAFFDDYFPRMFRFILRRVDGDTETARDIVQAALTKAVRKLDTYRGEASLFTWLCQIARRELADHVRRNAWHDTYTQRLVAREDDVAVRASLESMEWASETEPEAERRRDELAALVHAALDYLPRRYAQVLELKYLKDMSVEKIAERLGVTAVTVQSLLARARGAFRDATSALSQELDSAGLAGPTGSARGSNQ